MFQSVVHQFTLDTITGQLRSPSNVWTQSFLEYDSQSCLGYNQNNSSGYFPGGVYSKTCLGEDKEKFLFTGGQFTSSHSLNWTVISEGNLPWTSGFHRNPLGVEISSTYLYGDKSKYFAQVKFFNNSKPYYEYKIEFPEMRDSESAEVHFAELELPGLLMSGSKPPTSSPSHEPTKTPTSEPTRTPTAKPTSKPTAFNMNGDLTINKINRCGTSEVDARENCRDTCDAGKTCPL